MNEEIESIKQQIAVIEQVQALSDQRVDQIGGWLGKIYQDAEQVGDAALMQTCSETWEVVQSNKQATSIASAALTGLIEAVQQRDTAIYDLNKLEDGIDELESEGTTKNPRLRGAAHILYEVLRDRWEKDGLHLDCPGCTAHQYGWEDIDHEAINMLCHTLFDPPSGALPKELRTELVDFLNMWNAKLEYHMNSESEGRQRRAAGE